MKSFNLLVVLIILTISSLNTSAATYNLTFKGFWNPDQVPQGTFPSGAHFTNLVGASHVPGNPLWYPGQIATLGIENVAERGKYDELENEVINLQNSGLAGDFINTNGFPFSRTNPSTPDNFRFSITTFTATDQFSEISLISMIAPSPDWFVGVSGLSLKDENGWIDNLIVDLVAWDAGTENGDFFDLFNIATSPQQVIRRRLTPFIDDPVIGQIELQLVSIPTTPVPLPPALWLLLSGFFFIKKKHT